MSKRFWETNQILDGLRRQDDSTLALRNLVNFNSWSTLLVSPVPTSSFEQHCTKTSFFRLLAFCFSHHASCYLMPWFALKLKFLFWEKQKEKVRFTLQQWLKFKIKMRRDKSIIPILLKLFHYRCRCRYFEQFCTNLLCCAFCSVCISSYKVHTA